MAAAAGEGWDREANFQSIYSPDIVDIWGIRYLKVPLPSLAMASKVLRVDFLRNSRFTDYVPMKYHRFLYPPAGQLITPVGLLMELRIISSIRGSFDGYIGAIRLSFF